MRAPTLLKLLACVLAQFLYAERSAAASRTSADGAELQLSVIHQKQTPTRSCFSRHLVINRRLTALQFKKGMHRQLFYYLLVKMSPSEADDLTSATCARGRSCSHNHGRHAVHIMPLNYHSCLRNPILEWPTGKFSKRVNSW